MHESLGLCLQLTPTHLYTEGTLNGQFSSLHNCGCNVARDDGVAGVQGRGTQWQTNVQGDGRLVHTASNNICNDDMTWQEGDGGSSPEREENSRVVHHSAGS